MTVSIKPNINGKEKKELRPPKYDVIPNTVSILASTLDGGIGKDNSLPWHIKDDLKHFAKMTNNKQLLVGRKTYESMGPLPGRDHVIVTRDTSESRLNAMREIKGMASANFNTLKAMSKGSDATGLSVTNDWLTALKDMARKRQSYVIGGAQLYDEVHNGASEYVVWTRVIPIGQVVTTDTSVDLSLLKDHYNIIGVTNTSFAPLGKGIPGGSDMDHKKGYLWDIVLMENKQSEGKEAKRQQFANSLFKPIDNQSAAGRVVHSPGGVAFNRVINSLSPESILYPKHEEYQYLDAIKDIIGSPIQTDDRTNVGTVTKFGAVMRFDLRHTFPLLTTKKVFWKGVVEELLWFLKGRTNAKELSDKGVRIWDGNATKEYLKTRGLDHYPDGELGPVYGFQWRHFGGVYNPDKVGEDKGSGGVDQVVTVIKQLLHDPASRRIILSAWNPAALHNMALPPCHVLAQWQLDKVPGTGKRQLSCVLFQRSGDFGLGIPFNIASYSLLTLILCKLTGCEPGEFVHIVGNAHVYKNHVEPLKQQLKRHPNPFPRVIIKDSVFDSVFKGEQSSKLSSTDVVDRMKKLSDDQISKLIEGLDASQIQLLGYNPQEKVEMEMAV